MGASTFISPWFWVLAMAFVTSPLHAIMRPQSTIADVGEVADINLSDEDVDTESELLDELKANRRKALESREDEGVESDGEEFGAARWIPVGKRFKEKAEPEVRRGEVIEYPSVLVEIFKVRVNSKGTVIDSILPVRGSDGERKEFALLSINGELKYVFAVSTAQSYQQRYHATREKRVTPSTPEGEYVPQSLVRRHWSQAYKAWMPHAIFFNGGIALHATTPSHFGELGEKDSGGCTRLHPRNAKIVWAYVNPANTDIYGGAPLSEIQDRVKIKVYGYDRTGLGTRAALGQKYGAHAAWIQAQLRADLAAL